MFPSPPPVPFFCCCRLVAWVFSCTELNNCDRWCSPWSWRASLEKRLSSPACFDGPDRRAHFTFVTSNDESITK